MIITSAGHNVQNDVITQTEAFEWCNIAPDSYITSQNQIFLTQVHSCKRESSYSVLFFIFEAAASSAEPVNAAAEPAPVDEPEAPVDVITESVAAPAEPVADSTGEPVVESATPEEDVAVVSEVIATEDEAMPSAVEDAPPVVAEAAPILEDAPPVVAEAAPTPAEVTEETPAEAPASAGTNVVDEAHLPSPPAEAETVPCVDNAA